MTKDAEISACGRYRWWLSRVWEPSKPVGAFISLNPSIADADIDDQTIRKDIGFAKRWGWGGFFKFNLFPYRSTKPAGLWAANDPVGERGDSELADAATRGFVKLVAAWGSWTHPRVVSRISRVLAGPLRDAELWSIGAPSKGGHPPHPLMLPYDRDLQRWPASPTVAERSDAK